MILPNFIPIPFETTEPQTFEERSPNKNNKVSSDMESVSGTKTI